MLSGRTFLREQTLHAKRSRKEREASSKGMLKASMKNSGCSNTCQNQVALSSPLLHLADCANQKSVVFGGLITTATSSTCGHPSGALTREKRRRESRGMPSPSSSRCKRFWLLTGRRMVVANGFL